MTKSKGMHPGAHPTAPGGMSEKALVAELVNKHGYHEDAAKALKWPEKIDAVIEGRRNQEQKAKDNESATVDIDCPHGSNSRCDCYDLDPEEFFAEIEEAQAEGTADLNDTALFIGMPHVRDFIFDNHAGAGPSGAERWMTCTESLGAARRFLETLTPEQQEVFAQGGSAARQGTTAHAAAEAEALLLLGRIDVGERDATLLELSIEPPGDEAYDDEMGEYISEHVDLIRTYADERGDDHVFIEQRVEAAIPMPDGKVLPGPDGEDVYVITGSADVAVMPTKAEPDLVVIDLKYGNGIDVEVDENPQTRIYALGVLALLTDDEGDLITPVKTVTYVIAQPRLGGIKTYTETLDDLLDWRDDVLSPALYAALTGDGAEFKPSEKACQWCPARGACAALAEQRVAEGADLFNTIVEAEFEGGPGAFPETGSLDTARLGSLLAQIEGLVKIKDDLREEAQRRMLRGEAVPGYKLVGYTPPRKWVEDAEEEIANGEMALTSEQVEAMFVTKLITPKQAYTVLKKLYGMENAEDVIGGLHDHPIQKPVIARDDDRRHEWKGAPAEQMFPEIEDEDEDEEEVA